MSAPTETDLARAGLGRYYTLMDGLWPRHAARLESCAGAFDAIRREKAYRQLRYAWTLLGMEKQVVSEDKEKNPTTVESTPGEQKKDMFGEKGAEDAHCVPPDSETCAKTYGPIYQPITGVEIEKLSDNDLRKACKNIRLLAQKQEIQKEDIPGPPLSDNERKGMVIQVMNFLVNDCKWSLKNLAVNRLRMPPAHQVNFDTQPSLLYVPIMELSDIQKWKPGEGYAVIVVAADQTTYRRFVGALGMVNGMVNATPDEIRDATEALGAFVKGISETYSETRDDAVVTPMDFLDKNKDKAELEEMERVKAELRNNQVKVPVYNARPATILKIDFGAVEDPDYVAPDPMLLILKAAVNWFYFQYQFKLLPACGDVVDPEKALIEAINRELYEEDLRELNRPPDIATPEGQATLARRLGQASLSPTDDSPRPAEDGEGTPLDLMTRFLGDQREQFGGRRVSQSPSRGKK